MTWALSRLAAPTVLPGSSVSMLRETPRLAAQTALRSDPRAKIICERLDGRLPFDDGAIDVVFSNNFVECLSDRPEFTREVARILGPRGIVVAAHWDWDTQLFDGSGRTLVRRLMQACADWQQDWMEHADPWAGRRLLGLFQGSDLFRGTVHARTLVESAFAPDLYGYERAQDFADLVGHGAIDADDYEQFLSEQRSVQAQDRYIYALTEFVYVGQLV